MAAGESGAAGDLQVALAGAQCLAGSGGCAEEGGTDPAQKQ